MGAFKTGFDTVNLHRPTLMKRAPLNRSAKSCYQGLVSNTTAELSGVIQWYQTEVIRPI